MSKESNAANIGILIMDFINALKDENLKWHEETEDRRQELRVKRSLSVEKIGQEVQRLKQEFEKDVQRRQHDFEVEMEKKKRKAEAEVKNYQRFLDAIEDLREKLEEFYPGMQPALVLVIHEYATQLLHKMWESPDGREKLSCRRDLVEFLALVSEDTNPLALQGEASTALPHRTLKHIRGQ